MLIGELRKCDQKTVLRSRNKKCVHIANIRFNELRPRQQNRFFRTCSFQFCDGKLFFRVSSGSAWNADSLKSKLLTNDSPLSKFLWLYLRCQIKIYPMLQGQVKHLNITFKNVLSSIKINTVFSFLSCLEQSESMTTQIDCTRVFTRIQRDPYC